jgi:outer membrane protein assembly factor BamB
MPMVHLFIFKLGAIQRAVRVVDDIVYFGSRDYNLYALNNDVGSVKWFYHEPAGWIIAAPQIVNHEIFVGPSDAHKFYCFDRNTGKLKWQTNIVCGHMVKQPCIKTTC